MLIGYQLFIALAEIHDISVVHRDLKPGNVLLVDDCIVRLADFGSAKFLEPGNMNTPYIVSQYYRAPELFLCMLSYDYKVDVWAAGCVILELLNLQPIFKGKSEKD